MGGLYLYLGSRFGSCNYTIFYCNDYGVFIYISCAVHNIVCDIPCFRHGGVLQKVVSEPKVIEKYWIFHQGKSKL